MAPSTFVKSLTDALSVYSAVEELGDVDHPKNSHVCPVDETGASNISDTGLRVNVSSATVYVRACEVTAPPFIVPPFA